MSGSESYPKPSDEPDFSSLAEQMEEATPPWQISAIASDVDSNSELQYTTDENSEAARLFSQRTRMHDHILYGSLSFFGGSILMCASLLVQPAGALIFGGMVPYGICRLALGLQLWMNQPWTKSMSTAAERVFVVRSATAADEASICDVHLQAFPQKAEARLVEELCDEGFATISLLAVAGVRVVGHVLFSPIEIVSNAQAVRALALAPLGVLPAWQRHGVGTALIQAGLAQAARAGEKIVIVLGDPGYYRRFGFRSEFTAGLQSPYAGEHFMALELTPGALEGVTGEVRYSAPFERLG